MLGVSFGRDTLLVMCVLVSKYELQYMPILKAMTQVWLYATYIHDNYLSMILLLCEALIFMLDLTVYMLAIAKSWELKALFILSYKFMSSYID